MSFFSTRKFIAASIILAFSLILFFTWYTYQNVKKEERKNIQVTEALAVLHIMEKLMDDMQDIETGQRGFIITGNHLFLEPYHNALANLKQDTLDLRELALLYPRHSESFNALQDMISRKLDFVFKSIDIKKREGLDSATKNILSGQGKLIMDSIRVTVLNIENAGRNLLKAANSEREKAGKKSAQLFVLLAALFFATIIIFYFKIRRAAKNEILQEKRSAYLARLVESSGDAIFSCTPDFRIVFWNKAAEELYGYTRQEATGQHFLELLKTRSDEEKRNEVVQSVLQNDTYKGEFEYTSKKGETLSILSTIGALKDEKNDITGFVIVHRDITQKKQLQDRLKKFNQELELQVRDKTKIIRDVFERVSDAIVALDTDWRYTYVNRKAEQLFNKPPGYLIGKHIWTEFPDGVGQPFHKLYEEAMAKQEYRYLEEYYPPFNRWFENHIYPSPTGLSIYFKDISERKTIEATLKQAVQRFDMVANATNDILWETDLLKKTTWWNDNFYEKFGYTKNDDFTEGDVWEKLLHPDDKTRVIDNISFILNSTTGTSWIDEYRICRADGSYADIYDRCYIMRDEEGKAYKIVGSMTDISQLLQTREKLRITEDRYRIMIEEASDAIFINDAEGKLQDVNKRACELLGYSERELCTMRVEDLMTEDDLMGKPIMYDELLSGKRTSLERNMRHKDGSLVPVDITARMISDGRIIAIVRDITKRKEAEQQLAASEKSLRQILAGTAEIFYVIDRNYRITLINKAAEKKLTMAWGQAVKTGSNILEMIPPDEIDQAKESLAKVFEGKKVEYELPLTVNELPAWVAVSFLPVFDEEDTIIGAYISSKDISAKKNSEIILKDSEEKRRLIMNAALDAIVSINASGAIIFWNPQAEKIFGWSEQEIKGSLLSHTIIPQRYRESHKAGMARYLKTGEGGIVNRLIELPAINKAGYEFPIELSIIPVVQEGVTTFTAFIRDITERKKAAAELSLSVKRFDAIAAATHDALWEWNFETGELWANDMHQQLYGLKKSDPVPSVDEWKRRIHPDDIEKTTSAQDVALSSDTNYWESEYRFLRSDNQYISIYDRCYIVRNEEGKPIRLTGSMIDITQRKKNEDEVIKARNMADKMIDTLPGVFYFYDDKGKFIRWNTQFERATGYTAAEIANMVPLDFFPKEEKDYMSGRIQQVFEKGDSDAEANFLTKQGDRVPYYFKAVLVNYEGRPCLLGSGINISERKKAEEAIRASERKYKLLFENNPMPMWMLSLPEMNIIDVNEAAIQHYGYTRAEFLKLNAVDLRPEEEIARFKSIIRDHSSGINYSGVWRHKKKDGTLIDMEIIAHGINYDDKPARLILANDVTEKRISEALLKKSFEDIRQLTEHIQKVREEERAHIAREIHDELGQQLTVLKMDVSWLNKKMQADPAVAARLNELTTMLDGTVKTVRRISSELRPSLLDDLGLVATMDWHLKEFEKRTGIKTFFDEPDSIDVIAETTSTGLYRIFQESLTNVARHAEASTVYVSLVQTTEELLLKVQDNGKGFDKEKVANKRTLGILGMKERAEMMGGNYSISSEPGKGTTVVISISQPGVSGN